MAAGLLALLAFATVHALVIAPIWWQLAGGIPMSLVTGLALAWAFDGVARARGWRTVGHGLAFGVYMFGTLLPATAVDAAMRVNGVRVGDTTVGMAGAVALFVLSGLAAGWLLSRQRSVAIVCAVAALALMVIAGGPLPVAQSTRGFWLSAGIGCIVAAAGAAIAAVRSTIARRL